MDFNHSHSFLYRKCCKAQLRLCVKNKFIKVWRKNNFCAFQWEDLNKEKPSDDFEDPRDVAEIKYALEHIGDFKLKTAANYVVPEHLRMNTARKLVQLMLLQEKVSLGQIHLMISFLKTSFKNQSQTSILKSLKKVPKNTRRCLVWYLL